MLRRQRWKFSDFPSRRVFKFFLSRPRSLAFCRCHWACLPCKGTLLSVAFCRCCRRCDVWSETWLYLFLWASLYLACNSVHRVWSRLTRILWLVLLNRHLLIDARYGNFWLWVFLFAGYTWKFGAVQQAFCDLSFGGLARWLVIFVSVRSLAFLWLGELRWVSTR